MYYSKLNNGDSSSTDAFLLEDIDCKSDCMFKNTTQQQQQQDVIFGNKTDDEGDDDVVEAVKDLKLATVTNGFESICLQNGSGEDQRSDINHNGGIDVNGRDEVDSDTECTEPSEITVKSTETNYERSVETSTETLVSEHVLCG